MQRPTMICTFVLWIALLLPSSLGFTASRTVPSLSRSRTSRQTSIRYTRDDYLDHPDAAEPLTLSSQDLERLSELKSRAMTIPIVIMDTLLPGQKLYFQSPDPKFEQMLKYILDSRGSKEIGIVGFNPHDGQPLNMGVTAPISKKDITFGITKDSKRVMATSFKGQRRFVVVGEPWMDDSRSFYLANVEIVDNRQENLPENLAIQAAAIHHSIPGLVDEWVEQVIKSEKTTPAVISDLLKEIGPMPSSQKERAIWVAALVNPIVPLKVCSEIRPAMLACRNDHDRLVLASTALMSSIDHLSDERSLF